MSGCLATMADQPLARAGGICPGGYVVPAGSPYAFKPRRASSRSTHDVTEARNVFGGCSGFWNELPHGVSEGLAGGRIAGEPGGGGASNVCLLVVG
jgi:hypothetical protein